MGEYDLAEDRPPFKEDSRTVEFTRFACLLGDLWLDPADPMFTIPRPRKHLRARHAVLG